MKTEQKINGDHNLYFSTPGPVHVQAIRPVSSPLGKIIFAGTKWNSQATYGHASSPDYMRPTPHYLLTYTLEGEADYIDDTGVKTILRKGTLTWTRPGVNQSYGPRTGERWSEFFIWFNGRVFDTWQDCGFPGVRSRVLSLKPVKYWLKQFCAIVQPSEDSPLNNHTLRICQLQQILAEALHIQEASDNTSEDVAWLENACRKLTGGTLTTPPLLELAKSMGMSYSLFRKRFMQLTGKSPGAFRADEIIRLASLRLLETSDLISQISEHYGFHDQFHFSRRFKQMTGMSPKEFRRQVVSPEHGQVLKYRL